MSLLRSEDPSADQYHIFKTETKLLDQPALA